MVVVLRHGERDQVLRQGRGECSGARHQGWTPEYSSSSQGVGESTTLVVEGHIRTMRSALKSALQDASHDQLCGPDVDGEARSVGVDATSGAL